MADERLDKNGVEVEVGHRVMIKKISAVVRFVGTATFKPGLWVGLEVCLDSVASRGVESGGGKWQWQIFFFFFFFLCGGFSFEVGFCTRVLASTPG